MKKALTRNHLKNKYTKDHQFNERVPIINQVKYNEQVEAEEVSSPRPLMFNTTSPIHTVIRPALRAVPEPVFSRPAYVSSVIPPRPVAVQRLGVAGSVPISIGHPQVFHSISEPRPAEVIDSYATNNIPPRSIIDVKKTPSGLIGPFNTNFQPLHAIGHTEPFGIVQHPSDMMIEHHDSITTGTNYVDDNTGIIPEETLEEYPLTNQAGLQGERSIREKLNRVEGLIRNGEFDKSIQLITSILKLIDNGGYGSTKVNKWHKRIEHIISGIKAPLINKINSKLKLKSNKVDQLLKRLRNEPLSKIASQEEYDSSQTLEKKSAGKSKRKTLKSEDFESETLEEHLSQL
jgi:hypothetical protein